MELQTKAQFIGISGMLIESLKATSVHDKR